MLPKKYSSTFPKLEFMKGLLSVIMLSSTFRPEMYVMYEMNRKLLTLYILYVACTPRVWRGSNELFVFALTGKGSGL